MRFLEKIQKNKIRKILASTISAFTIILLTSTQVFATTTETYNAGAYIIDMGQSPQTIANGLKPYGLVYDLIINENVPVNWIIEPNKEKDGIDFSADGTDYRGGSFIIPVEYMNGNVESVINTWRAKGVVVNGPISSSFTAPLYDELTSWPRAVLDDQNDGKIVPFYTNAEIPTSSYTTAGNPTLLTDCGDVYVMPHADPHNWNAAWQQALLDFVVDGGYLWAACHAVSSLELLVDIDNDGNPDCDFLSDGGLKKWNQHNNGTPPYTYTSTYSGDPIMQFMGSLDNATRNGSEQIYMPLSTSSWRNTTKIAVYDPDHNQADAGDAAVVAYGNAFGNPNYGYVMYEGGHDLNKHSAGVTSRVAAQRAYFNFLLMSGEDKEISVNSTVPAFVLSGSTINISATGSSGNSPYSYQWSSTCTGGSFGDATNSSTTYTAPTVSSNTTCVITVQVTDNCGRFTFESTSVVVGVLTGPTAVNDNATTPMNTAIDINALSNDTQGSSELDPTSVSFVSGTEPNASTEGTFSVNNTTGLVTFTPVNGYTGTVTINYNVCDLNNLCDVATITVEITTVAGPTANNDNATSSLNTPVDIDALSNDTQGVAALDPTSVTFIPGTEPNPSTEGTFTVNNTTGLVTFTPVNGFTGAATINYSVCDLNNLCDVATISVFIATGNDTDGDGCTDDVDEYPNDPDRCFNNYYPAAGNGTLAYEDLWPGKGDFDFNDLIIDYRFMTVTNSSNHIVETYGTFILKAYGAALENGFGFQLANNNIAGADITSVTGYNLQEGYINLEANGIEEGQTIPTIIVYDNAYNILPHPGSGIGVNTEPSATYVEPDTLNMYMAYTANTYTLAELDLPNFNPFLIVDLTRGIEVHLPDYPPTDLADESIFGTFDDDTDAGAGKYYKTESNLPWAIHIPEPFDYPIEKNDITSVYLKFAEWAESNGTLFQDWYQDKAGYRNSSLIYTHD